MTVIEPDRLRSTIKTAGISKSDLVKRSGVSRAQLHRLLSSNQGVTVREQTLNSLATALEVNPIELAAGGKLNLYRKWVADQHEFVDFRGIGLPLNHKQRIEDIYVEPDVILEKKLSDHQCLEGKNQSFGNARRLSPPTPVTEAIQTNDRIVLLGDPGSGKTTVLRNLAFTNASTGHLE